MTQAQHMVQNRDHISRLVCSTWAVLTSWQWKGYTQTHEEKWNRDVDEDNNTSLLSWCIRGIWQLVRPMLSWSGSEAPLITSTTS